jgi:hypothetical protein
MAKLPYASSLMRLRVKEYMNGDAIMKKRRAA